MLGLGPQEWAAVALSLKVALVATILSLPLAIYVAHLLARKSFPGKQLLNAAVHLPLILPPVVTGYLLLLTFGTQGAIGAFLAKFGIILAFKWTGAVLAAAIMAFPLMVRAIRLGIEAVDPKLEQAATTLGSSPWKVFTTITLPMCLPSIIAGAVLAFAKAMGEFGATITYSFDHRGHHHRRNGAAHLRMARNQGGAPMSTGHHIRIRQQLGRFTLDVDLQNDTGGVTAIFGPSGSGKTSLINAIAGLTQPQEAFIQIGDRVLSDTAKGTFVKPHERRVGYVFQDARLFPHLTVEKNLRYGAPPGASLTKTTELLGIDHLLDRLPNALSGGEAQRVAIGRALLSQPDILPNPMRATG